MQFHLRTAFIQQSISYVYLYLNYIHYILYEHVCIICLLKLNEKRENENR